MTTNDIRQEALDRMHASDLKVSVTIKTRIIDATDKESSRYAIGNVQVVPGDRCAWLAATDGRIAAVVQAQGFAHEQTMIPHAVLPDRKKDFGRDGTAVILNGRWEATPNEVGKRHAGEAKIAEPVDGRFPHMTDLFHALPAELAVTIDARRLLSLVDAINRNGNAVTLLLNIAPDGNPCSPIRVLGEHGIGVIAPLSNDRKPSAAQEYERLARAYGEAAHKAREAERKAKESAEQAPPVREVPAPKQPRQREPKSAGGARELVGSASGY